LIKWHQKNRRDFPWRTRRDPYVALLAEILLQRTPADRVSKFFPKFIEKFPAPHIIATANIESLQEFLRPMGLQKRAIWLVKLMKEVCEKHSCKIPDREEDLARLPGIGLYTARAILCFGFGEDVPIVDVNVARVLWRVFRGSDVKKRPSENKLVWKLAGEIVPKGSGPLYNEALLDHAALICKKQPKCNICPVSEICRYHKRAIKSFPTKQAGIQK
jgi:A/G-specific adenine glycosylase